MIIGRCSTAAMLLQWPRQYGPRAQRPRLRLLLVLLLLMESRTFPRRRWRLWPRCLTTWPRLLGGCAWRWSCTGDGSRRRRRVLAPSMRTAESRGVCGGLVVIRSAVGPFDGFGDLVYTAIVVLQVMVALVRISGF
jgi:hypothetical protein